MAAIEFRFLLVSLVPRYVFGGKKVDLNDYPYSGDGNIMKIKASNFRAQKYFNICIR